MFKNIGIRFTFLSLFLSMMQLELCAQITMPDTVCLNKPVDIKTTLQAESYYWNFCSGNLQDIPQGKQLQNIMAIDKPAFIDYAFYDNQIYAVVTNHQRATITLLEYGNNIKNAPTATDLGNFNNKTPSHTQGIQIINDGGNWYIFIVGGQKSNSELVRLSFGNSLKNVPTVDEFYFPNQLDYPIDLVIASENGQWYGFTASYKNNAVVRFSFGSSLNNSPTAETIASGNNLNNPCGLTLFQENGLNLLFVTNYSGNSISRLSLGASLANSVQNSNFASNSLQFPFDMTLLRDCEKLYGFVLNRFGGITRIELTEPLSDLQFTPLGNASYLFNPQGISDVYRIGDTLYASVANIDNSTIAQLQFPACTDAAPSWSDKKEPQPVVFTKLGNINVRLETTESGIKKSYCKNIEVVENPEIDLPSEVLLLPGEKVDLDAGDGYASYSWSTGSTNRTTTVDKYGIYKVTVTNKYGCSAEDSIEVKFAGIPSVITPNGDGSNDTWEIRMIQFFTSAEISIYDRFGNLIIKYDGTKQVWNACYGNGQPVRPDTYWYVIDLGGGNRIQKGQVSVVRN